MRRPHRGAGGGLIVATLHLLQGPAGAGKSQEAQRQLQGGLFDVVADVTAIWAGLRLFERGADGLFPTRASEDVALSLARYLQVVLVREALRQNLRVVATTSRRGQEPRWERLAVETGAAFRVETLDPGRAVVEKRLQGPDGQLSDDCRRALERWYG